MKELQCPRCERAFDCDAKFCSGCAGPLERINVTCNMCGGTCMLGDPGCPVAGLHGLIKQVVNGGYESTPGNGHGALDDGTSYTFSLCEFCLDWLFSRFKVPVAVSSYMGQGSEPEAWRPASGRVAEDEWRKMREEFTKEHDKRAEARNK